MGAPEFRLEVAVGRALAALRRYGWLMALVMLLDGGLEIAARLAVDRALFLGTDWTLAGPAVTVFQRGLAAGTAAVLYLLTFAGGRGEPLQPVRMARRLASALPVVLLVEVVYTLPGVLAALTFQSIPPALQAVGFVRGLYHLALFLSLSLLVPAVLDRGLTLSAAISRSLLLISGRRWPLFLMTLAPLIVVGVIQFVLIGRAGQQPPLAESWPVFLATYPIYGLVPVVIAAVYMEADGAKSSAPEQLAETFE